MSHIEAKKYDVGIESLTESTKARVLNHYNNLDNRPDYDGYLTLKEANDWYRNGKGQTLFTDLNKIDLSMLKSLGDQYVGQTKDINLFIASASLNDALVYGTITLKRYPDNSVKSFSDKYDFDYKSWFNPFKWGRNIETCIGSLYAGKGTSFEIVIYGRKKLKKMPFVK